MAVAAPRTVEEARARGVCRVCGRPMAAPFTLNYGREYAHTACLPAAPPAPEVPLDRYLARHGAILRERHAEGECAGLDCPYCDYAAQRPIG